MSKQLVIGSQELHLFMNRIMTDNQTRLVSNKGGVSKTKAKNKENRFISFKVSSIFL